MPDVFFQNVKDLFVETHMSTIEFRVFVKIIRFNAMRYLDSSGAVSIEEQDPAALRRVLDQVKKFDSTIAKRYPYLWPVLAYLELYLWGKHKGYVREHPHTAMRRPVWMSRPGAMSDIPVYKRFARSKTGKSLREISKTYRFGPVSHYTRSRKHHRQPTAGKPKRESTVTDSEAEERITAPVDSSPTCSCSTFTTHVRHWFQSFGSCIEDICTHFIGG
ncbi:hypothetical protein L210DRAFT_978808 [Boletus edulis BED1]|uniref:Uncharacterized protein n=1 Tax=Boletus edulis BED1 TaxID=1328754 RepID=A0AAD4C3X9_BOLED|nr:hypothetical protein L210DRAFT_978808 [Boletus edulis BED1]